MAMWDTLRLTPDCKLGHDAVIQSLLRGVKTEVGSFTDPTDAPS